MTHNKLNYIGFKPENKPYLNPPSTNRGVTQNHNPSSNSKVLHVSKPFFDWFEGMIKGEFDDIFIRLQRTLSSEFDEIQGTKYGHKIYPQRGWQHSFCFLKNNDPVLTISYGGQNSIHGIYYKTTSSNAMKIATILQNEFIFNTDSPILIISRIDVAIDMIGDYQTIVDIALRFRDNFQVKTNGDWTVKDDPNGKTLYLQLNQKLEVRIYEKGKELRVKDKDSNAPLNLIRFELQMRKPKGSNNKLFGSIMAGATPKEILDQYLPFVEILKSIGVPNINFNPIKWTKKMTPSSFDLKTDNMIKQYGKHLSQIFATKGSANIFLAKLFPNELDIPDHLKTLLFQHIKELNFLKHGEY